jgi:hypothetical protein
MKVTVEELCAQIDDLREQLEKAREAYELKVQDFAAETRRSALLIDAILKAGHTSSMGTVSKFRDCSLCTALREAGVPEAH